MTNDISNLNQVNNIVSLNTFCRWRTMGSRHRYINFKILLIAYFPKSSRANTKWNIKFTDIQRFFFLWGSRIWGRGLGVVSCVICRRCRLTATTVFGWISSRSEETSFLFVTSIIYDPARVFAIVVRLHWVNNSTIITICIIIYMHSNNDMFDNISSAVVTICTFQRLHLPLHF